MKASAKRHGRGRRGSIAKAWIDGVMSNGALHLAVASLVVQALGCAAGNTAVAGKSPVLTSRRVWPTPTPTPVPSRVVVSPNVQVSDELAAICSVDFDDIESAPKFDFARSDLLTEHGEVLAQIARCVTAGTLAGRALVLVGRADPRGESEYNMALGE